MNFFSDTQETTSRFGDHIDDLHDVFRCHGVDFGLPEDFFAFARTMKYHSDLRGDVLRVVKFVMESETNISFRTILTIIAMASGGPEVGTYDGEMSIPVNLVIESLIGVSACSRLKADHPDGLYSDLTVEPARVPALEATQVPAMDGPSAGGGEPTGHTEEEETLPMVALDGSSSDGAVPAGYTDVQAHTDAEETFFKKTGDSSIDQIPPSPPNGYSGPVNDHQSPLGDHGGSNTLAESLTRLELNSLQLKIYLDSIDQRISRMEPRLENVAPLVLSAPAPHPRDEAGARFSAIIPAETDPPLPHHDSPVSNQQDREATEGTAATAPLASPMRLWTDFRGFSSARPSAVPILVGAAMLLLAAFLFLSFGRDTGYAVIHPVKASGEGGVNAGGSSLAPKAASAVSDPRVGPTGEPQVAPVSHPSVAPVSPVIGAEGTSNFAHGSGGTGGSPPVEKQIRSPKPAQISLKSRSQASESSAADAEPSSEMAADTSDETDPAVRTYGLSSAPLSNHLVKVSSGVMAANLLSGPKPSYPTLASLTRTQGNVVMQAVISKNGTVEHLHVIKGHRLLRGAAKNAVKTWRYRPYKIGGVPVEVATIVSVDFSLHH
jgi:TonB family protein